jgi:hypothetical protein
MENFFKYFVRREEKNTLPRSVADPDPRNVLLVLQNEETVRNCLKTKKLNLL